MKAIDFVVRDSAGGLQRGVVSSESNTHVIEARSGQEISLNLRQAELHGQVRAGNDLVVTLADGRVITIDNFFNTSGDANRLFVSSEGYLNEVSFADTASGQLHAQFGPTEEWGKWSPSDDLIYLGRTEVASAGAGEEVSMFGAPLLGGGLLSGGAGVAAAVVGGAAVLGGIGGGDGTPGAVTPFVNEPDSSTDIAGDSPPLIVVTGGGEPGDDVTVNIGDESLTTTIDENGEFEVTFEGENFPEDGHYEAVVVISTEEGEIVLDGPGYVIDTTPPEINITTGTESVNDFFNADSFADGVTLTGTGEPGASLDVTIAGITQSTVVAEDGSWSVAWDVGELEAGEYSTGITFVSSDAFGNTTTITDNLIVDTITNVTINTDAVETDGVVNGEEILDGVTLTGTAQVGSSVVVTFGTGSHEAIADADGDWSVDFAADEVPTGELFSTATAVATDSSGNQTSATGDVQIDTVPPAVAVVSGTQSVNDFFNAESFADGVTLTGTGEAGASISVTIAGIAQTTTVTVDGTWSVSWDAGTLVDGEYTTAVSIVSSDAFGNTTTVSDNLVVDTVTSLTINTDTVETDGIVNGVEIQDGVTLTGTTQIGSSVVVTFGTGTHDATVDADGNWSADFAMSELPTGEVSAPVSAIATDSSGNTTTAAGDVNIDTFVRDFGYTATTGGADGVINTAEAAAGFEMTGTTEVGSSVSVTMNGFTHQATVAADGTWTVSFTQSEIPGGEQTVTMTATATDIAGNVDTITQDVMVDRDAGILTISATPVEGDDVVNEVEASDGVTLTGTSDAGAVVTVTMAGVSHDVVTDAAGNWTVDFAAGEVAPGDYTADIHASTVDASGNALEATDSVHVDTRVDNLSIDVGAVGAGDGVINSIERLDGGGMAITGTTEVGSTSVVVTLDGVDVAATVDASGNWTALFAASQVAEGTYAASASVTATDAAGNVASVSGTIQVDTEVVPFAVSQSGGGADGVLSAEEAATGIDLGGQVEVGSGVVVNFNGTDFTATVDADGNWSLSIPPNAITAGTYDAVVNVTATDIAGNIETLSNTLAIDTEAPTGPVIASYTRDGEGIRGISTNVSTDDLVVHEVEDDGTVTEVVATQVDIPGLGESNFQFDSEVPDGSHLVITSTDAAGNVAGTYVVLDDEAASTVVELDGSSLSSLNIETLDLNFAEESNVTIDAETLLALSSNSNELQITGGTDDQVTITGAVQSGSTVVDGQNFNIYTLGDEGTLIIDDNINVII